MPAPIFGQEFYDKWFVPKPMSDARRAEFERQRAQKTAHEREVLITPNAAWIVFNEFYPDGLRTIKPSSLTDPQILMAQRLLTSFVDGRRRLQSVSALAQSVLYKSPQSLSGLGLILFNFVRKLPSDAFAGGMPSQAAIASLQGRTDLKAYVANRLRDEVSLAFDGLSLKPVEGSFFF